VESVKLLQLKEEITTLLQAGGAPQAGIADLTLVPEALNKYADLRLTRFVRAVSFLVPFPRSVVTELLDGPSLTYLHYYRAVNTRIDDLALQVTALLEDKGFSAFPVPSSQRTGKHKLESIFPHRLAARLAGLGWIGKSGCLVNKTYGPRLRLGTVLCDAPLPADSELEILCAECTSCTLACPAGAIKGKLFLPEMPLNERLVPELCDSYLDRVRDRFGKRICGLCLAACPFGKPGSEPEHG
jgi:epoxyqueuosine reductase QueG